MDNGGQGSKDARTGAWVVMQHASQPPHDLRSGAYVPRGAYLFRNLFRAAILYANFHLCSMNINALQQLGKRKKLRLMLGRVVEAKSRFESTAYPMGSVRLSRGARLIEQLS